MVCRAPRSSRQRDGFPDALARCREEQPALHAKKHQGCTHARCL
ncbi:Hypothetical protein CAP_5487 [Chondromyces apiculatus DSM 436]|uniref:Uncharacterized protein n=1 Tax=Chondromyces apiculatus DSM 436 TaxID=1192034 RepID=A0A017T2P8_9BACT|nr:Hypothetical protein CAP_5487 [Chondromyces apiculatus DSM 436]